MKTFYIFLLIFCLALFLRTFNLENIYVFNLDEEYQATYAWTLVKDPHPIWIGVVAAAIEFYLGPYFTYFTALLLKISGGDPMITAYFAAFIGSITSAVIFLVGKYFFNFTTGILASLLYTTLPIFVFFDQKYWNAMFDLLVILLMFVSVNLVKKSKWWWVLFAFLVGVIFETHLAPLPLVLIGVWYFIKGKYWKDAKLTIICLCTFLLLYWPLIIFDFNHNFSNITFFSKLNNKAAESKISFTPALKTNSLFDSMGRFWFLNPGVPNADEVNFGCTSLSGANGYEIIDKYTQRTYAPFWLSLVTLLTFGFYIWKNFSRKEISVRLLTTFLVFSFVSFIIYPGGSFEYYSLGFLMLFCFVPGLLISKMSGKLKVFAIFGILLAAAIGVNTVLNSSDDFSLGPKKLLINKVMSVVGNDSFSIEGRGICHDYEGWRYLFKIYGRMPSQSYTDRVLGWLYPEEISIEPPKYTIILSEDRIPLNEDLTSLQSFTEGGYKAYIKTNENSVFE